MNRRNFLKLCGIAAAAPAALLVAGDSKKQITRFVDFGVQHEWDGYKWKTHYPDYYNNWVMYTSKQTIKQLEEAMERMEFNRPMMMDIIGA